MDHPMLRADQVTKKFAGVTALDAVSLDFERGRITGLIGQNGSGKSTLINCITGFEPLDGGAVWLGARRLDGLAPDRIARQGVIRTFQQVSVYDEFSVQDNLLMAAQEHDGAGWADALLRSARVRGREQAARARSQELLALIGLSRYAQAPAGILSYGQKKLVSMAGSLMPRPQVVILDEPLAGVNPSRVREVEGAIRRLNEEGESFVIVEHNVESIMALCHRVVVLEQGRVIADGRPADVRADPQVIRTYLGRRQAA